MHFARLRARAECATGQKHRCRKVCVGFVYAGREVVANHFLPSALLNRIVLQSDGVPLFIEELAKTVLAAAAFVERHGVASPLTVPSTLQAALTARLDRLPAAKQVAQMGAVIGREFPTISWWLSHQSRSNS